MFDTYGSERLAVWKKIRDEIEKSEDAFSIVTDVWSRAPFVNQYLDPLDPESWPDPWHLVLDSKYDDLALALGMLYTLQLTDRFSTADFKIYMTSPLNKDSRFFLCIDDRDVLNLRYTNAVPLEQLTSGKISIIYHSQK